MTAASQVPSGELVVVAYDGSELAGEAIDEAATLISPGHQAIVLTVYQPFDLGFVPVAGDSIDAKDPAAVRAAAERVAEAGAARARTAGLSARGIAVEASPTWEGIVACADQHDARLIVLGSHGHTRLRDVVLGSVANAVASHSRRSVLITHARAGADN